MFPEFGSRRRREINLGGTSTAVTQASIIDRARVQREQRIEQKRRNDNAAVLQAWWRGMLVTRHTRRQLRDELGRNVGSITGLRCLVLIGADEEALAFWTQAMLQGGEGSVFQAALENAQSWLVLIRQITLLLLRSIARSSNAPSSLSACRVLQQVLSIDIGTRVLRRDAQTAISEILRYDLSRGYYGYLAQTLVSISIDSKNHPLLPEIVPLITIPLAFQPAQAIDGLLSHILPIPLLPNRLPITSLTQLSSQLPIANLPRDVKAPILSTESAVHLIANLVMFSPPRYAKMSADAQCGYLTLLTALLDSLPAHALEPSAAAASTRTSGAVDDSEEEDLPTVSVVQNFTPQVPLPKLDPKTLKRLKTLPSPEHISSLLRIGLHHQKTRMPFCSFILSLMNVWPSKKEDVLNAVLLTGGPGLIREIYRFFVRGKGDVDVIASPLLALVELYTRALLTMGDDEFFSFGSVGASSAGAKGNPLVLDELVGWSKQMLRIAWGLYWKEDVHQVVGSECGLGRWSLERVREALTRCLVAIHARDSRKPFMPKEHWLMSFQNQQTMDMQSFIEAAVYDLDVHSSDSDTASTHSKNLSKRQLAHLSPRLGILNNIPFAIPFETRVLIFRHFVLNDLRKTGNNRYTMEGRMNRHRVTVRRGRVAEDGFDRLGGADTDLKKPIEIQFINEFGEEEAGIDGGGVFKEFFTSLCKEVFDTNRGLWLANKKNELYPNPHGYAVEPHSLNWFRFIGRILGKAMYDGILVDVAFAGFFLAKWLGKQSFLDDLASLDPDLYNGLVFLKHYDGNFEDLALNFTVAVEEFGVTKTIDLVRNGSSIPVKRDNRLQYIALMAHYRLTKQIKRQSEAFFEGLSEMIDPKWLRMFNQQEVQILIGGVDTPVDLGNLRRHTVYGGLFGDDHETIQLFWKVVDTFDQEQKKSLLRFVTSCSRPPLLGFQELQPNFAIRDAGGDQTRLPTSSTCVNLLKLPRYESERVLRDKLLQAINSNAGFDLS